MTRWHRIAAHGLLCAVAIAAGARASLARPAKIALIPIAGDNAGVVAAVSDALDDSGLDLVASRKVNRAIDKLGLDDELTERQLERLAAELEVDAVVQGAFDARKHRLQLTIFAHGKNGKPIQLAATHPEAAKFRKLVRTTMIKLLAAVAADAADPDARDTSASARGKQARAKQAKDDAANVAAADDGSPATGKNARLKGNKAGDARADAAVATAAVEPSAKPSKAERTRSTEPDRAAPPAAEDRAGEPANHARAGKQVTERDDAAPGPSVHARLELGEATPRSANRVAARVELGASVTGRSLRFTSTSIANAPTSYSNAPVPGGRVEGELYPFAFGDPDGWLAGLGIAGAYDQTAALTLRATAEMTVPLKITERHYAVGARYRILLGHTETSPTITVGGGYAARTFKVDRAGLMSPSSIDLPDVDYRMFDPGVALRLPIGRRLALTLDGRALLVTSAGPIQLPSQYGQADIVGGDASAALEVVLGGRFALRLAGEVTQLDFKFAGRGALATSRDGDPSTIDVRGATDRYFGGSATLAVLY